MGTFSRLGNDLYSGRKSLDVVGRWKLWYGLSALVIALALIGLLVRGFNFGIEFTGGAEYRVTLSSGQVTQATADKVSKAVVATGVEAAREPVVTTSGSEAIIVKTEPVNDAESAKIVKAILDSTGAKENAISQTEIGPSWGKEVAKRSLIGLCVFLVLVMLFIWAYFREWKMSVAGIVALAHDVFITAGIYALSGFQVTPATVTGFLTILGFSLYDTVVVFDKVRENTKDLRRTRMTYAQATNLAVNQTLVRSINTSIVALIPVASILAVGVFWLGNGSLKDLALALFIGMAVGAYSSIFIAPPLLVQLKTREANIAESDRRARTRAKHDSADPYGHLNRTTKSASGRKTVDVDDDDAVATSAAPGRVEGTPGTGRTAPTTRAPIAPSAAAGGRKQPVRKPRSQRGKK